MSATLPKGFTSESSKVNGTTLHYVRGGNGSPVILIHGFPEDWYEWHAIMPRLAKKFTVIAVDLRGVGGSAATVGGYDAANLAEDIHQLVSALRASLRSRCRIQWAGCRRCALPLPSRHNKD